MQVGKENAAQALGAFQDAVQAAVKDDVAGGAAQSCRSFRKAVRLRVMAERGFFLQLCIWDTYLQEKSAQTITTGISVWQHIKVSKGPLSKKALMEPKF